MMKKITFLLFFALQFVYSQSYNFTDIFFLDDHNGWILGTNGYLWKTMDSGSNWLKIEEHRFNTWGKIQFTDEETGWIMIGGTLYSSKDGGLNWEYIYDFQSSGSANSFWFLNDSIGFCSSAATSLLRTTNAGITWNLISDTLYSINYLSSYGNLMFMGLAYRNLYRSTDLGENWTLSFNFPAIIKQVSMFDSNVGLMAYNYDDYISMGDILLTIDGGLTWEDWGSTLKFHFGISDVEFEGTDKGWVATNYKILKTTDAGVNWDSLSSPYPIPELEFFNDNVSYGTDFFHIYYTDDGWITYSIAD